LRCGLVAALLWQVIQLGTFFALPVITFVDFAEPLLAARRILFQVLTKKFRISSLVYSNTAFVLNRFRFLTTNNHQF
jgi:hypothetical protein